MAVSSYGHKRTQFVQLLKNTISQKLTFFIKKKKNLLYEIGKGARQIINISEQLINK